MLIGLDFDNTIVCYDRLFHRLAVERGLMPPALARDEGKPSETTFARPDEKTTWTELQGIAYGPRIADAEPFPGVKPGFPRALPRAGVAWRSSATRRATRIAAATTTCTPPHTRFSRLTVSTTTMRPA